MSDLDQKFRILYTTFSFNEVSHDIEYHYERSGKTITLSGALWNGVQVFQGMKQELIDSVIDEIKSAIDEEKPDADVIDIFGGKGYNQAD